MPILKEIKLSPKEAHSEADILLHAYAKCGIAAHSIQKIQILKKSLDARQNPVFFNVRIEIFLHDEPIETMASGFHFHKKAWSSTCHIIGMGPAGMFAALALLEKGIQPIILERGKPVKERRRDLAQINKERRMNPESNYCFGEGGAGTYSDGKLYTRSNKRGDIQKVLETFIQHGADPNIRFEAHPHIGTNKLPNIIERMRHKILEMGGEIHFEKKLVDITIRDNLIKQLICQDGSTFDCQQLILATGHSARDIFELLHRKGVQIEAKPFALGVRIEHPQEIINRIQYKRDFDNAYLSPASYSLVTQVNGNGVFSFCMCPGGIIAPAATDYSEVVVNGWSPSKRNGRFANSGMVVNVNPPHWEKFNKEGVLAALHFQKYIEQQAYKTTGSLQAPAQRVEDFIQNKFSTTLPECSYLPGVQSAALKEILPEYITQSLREGLIHFGKKMPAYRTNEAVLVGVESRTSSPVRIPRDKETLQHPQIGNLFPCGEGAGYAGGIMSAALDGIACAEKVAAHT
ncbi:MAG: FAD-binding protein [Chitinophagales bacterium]|nr:FAD-binding protein [Chitinophagales bacterium]